MEAAPTSPLPDVDESAGDAPAAAAAPPAEVAEVVTAEVVRTETPSEAAANEAIVRASDAALNNPGIPGRDEFLSLAMQARVLSMSGAAPKEVQNNPHLAFHIAMVGRDLGISPSAALELIDVIPGRSGKPPQLSLSPQLINGQIRRLGLGSIVPVIKSQHKCVAVALGPDGFYDPRCKPLYPDHHELCECTIRAFLGETEFTWEDARTAGLVMRDCEPGNHQCSTRDRKCNQGYQTYPKRMLWWRASGFLADDIFPEASLGMYTPEALGAIVDAEGRPIDPGEVELPAGYEPKAVGTGNGAGAASEPKPLAPPDVAQDLLVRIEALPAEQRGVLRERWDDSNRLRGRKVLELTEDVITLATSMVKGFEVIAARTGWDAAAARAEVEARWAAAAEETPGDPEAPGEPTEPTGPDGGDGPPDPPEGQGGAQGPGSAPAGDDPGDGEDPDDADGLAPPPKAGPDPEVAAWVREVSDAAATDQGDFVAATIAEVKAMHHAVLNRELTELGWAPEGEHIDTRRMVLAAARIEARLHPEQCKVVRCDEPAGDKGLCPGHTPF